MKNKKIKYVILTLILIVAIVVVVLILQNRKTCSCFNITK